MTEQHTGPDPNVLRLVRKCELEGVGDELEARWNRSENRASLRTLADSFNERLLRTTLATLASIRSPPALRPVEY